MTNEQLLEGHRLSQEIHETKNNIKAINTQYIVQIIGWKEKSLGVYEEKTIYVDGELKELIQKHWEEKLKELETAFEKL